MIKEVVLKPGKYSLRRERDGMGDSGPMFLAFNVEESVKKGDFIFEKDRPGLIKVGYAIQCGSPFARSFSSQDYWQTTAVTEILEVNEDKTEVKFKTGNSIYVAKSF